MTPAVSVLMPVYNAQRYLTAAVGSVLGQTFADFELIVVDDGSTDRSAAILARYAKDDPRVRIISRPNAGLVASLNEALAIARGPLVARMDADDICLPERFDRQVRYLGEHPECVLVGSAVVTMDQHGHLIGRMADIAFGHDNIDHALLHRGWPMVHPSAMIRTDALRKVGAYRSETWPFEDHDLFLRLAEQGRVENLPEVLLHYRKHAASISAQSGNADHIITGVIVDACRRRGVPVPAGVTAVRTVNKRKVDIERGWAWQAVNARNIGTARRYALHTLARRPLSLESWRLTYCAVRGH
jgi:glycosyltransferase involved in cell wall biosynthesis